MANQRVKKVDFLNRVARVGRDGKSEPYLRADDSYVADNIRLACEALALKLVRLSPDSEYSGYVLRITPGGIHLAAGNLEEAAAAVDSGRALTRMSGPEPAGPVAVKFPPGGTPVALGGQISRNHAAEILRCIATGYLVVEEGHVRSASGLPVASRSPASRVQAARASAPLSSIGERRRQVAMRR